MTRPSVYLDWNATIGSAWLSFDALFAAATQRGEILEPALASDSETTADPARIAA